MIYMVILLLSASITESSVIPGQTLSQAVADPLDRAVNAYETLLSYYKELEPELEKYIADQSSVNELEDALGQLIYRGNHLNPINQIKDVVDVIKGYGDSPAQVRVVHEILLAVLDLDSLRHTTQALKNYLYFIPNSDPPLIVKKRVQDVQEAAQVVINSETLKNLREVVLKASE